MRVEEFQPEALAEVTRHRFYLEIGFHVDGKSMGIPVLYARNGVGPRLVVLAGVHGDEYEGVAAIHEAFRRLDPAQMRGSLLAVPMLNLPAGAAVQRVSPLDHLNLARVFPGRANGTITERIAHYTTEHIIARADLLVDLHAAGSRYSMPTLCGYCTLGDAVGERSAQAARAFGAPVIWKHDEVPPGRTLSAAFQKGIPSVYAETTGGSWIRQADVEAYVRGIFNLMRHLGILAGTPDPPAREPRMLSGGGDLDFSIPADRSGYLLSRVELLQAVEAGDLLGTIYDLFGDPIQEIRAPNRGYVVLRRETPMIIVGEMAYALTSEELSSPD